MYEIGIRYVNELFFSQVTRRKTSNDIYTCKRNIYAILPTPLLSTSTPSSSCNHEHCTAARADLNLSSMNPSITPHRDGEVPIDTDMSIQDTSACLVTIGDHPSGM